MAQSELQKYEADKLNLENRIKVMEDFRDSAAGTLIKEIFEEEMQDIEDHVRKIIQTDMKAVFLMKESEKKEHIEQLSKKELVLSEVLGVILTIKGRVFPA